MASDGVWDFMTPLEAVSFVARHTPPKPSPQSSRDVAHLLVEEVLRRAAAEAGPMSLEDLKQLPPGRQRRSLHDDTTVIVVYL
jgi:pyruvate dehydrogenase phosphatase